MRCLRDVGEWPFWACRKLAGRTSSRTFTVQCRERPLNLCVVRTMLCNNELRTEFRFDRYRHPCARRTVYRPPALQPCSASGTGHEQADPETRRSRSGLHQTASRRPARRVRCPARPATLPICRCAGPGVRALLAADPSFDVARFLEGSRRRLSADPRGFWKGDIEAMQPYVVPMSSKPSPLRSSSGPKMA